MSNEIILIAAAAIAVSFYVSSVRNVHEKSHKIVINVPEQKPEIPKITQPIKQEEITVHIPEVIKKTITKNINFAYGPIQPKNTIPPRLSFWGNPIHTIAPTQSPEEIKMNKTINKKLGQKLRKAVKKKIDNLEIY